MISTLRGDGLKSGLIRVPRVGSALADVPLSTSVEVEVEVEVEEGWSEGLPVFWGVKIEGVSKPS